MTAHALRRHLSGGADTFPRDVVELLHYFDPAKPGQAVRAVPGEGQAVETWILGSSTFGAQLAAMLGLPYAFASHFAPADLERALAVYRQQFQPSERCPRPHVMLGVNVVGAETDREARRLLTSLQQAVIALRTGNPGKLPPPVDDIEIGLEPMARTMLDQMLSTAVVGSPQAVRTGLAAFAERTGADELMITSSIYDHAARLRSFEIAAETRDTLAA
jgi:luciferase family oxidoreductase group 1